MQQIFIKPKSKTESDLVIIKIRHPRYMESPVAYAIQDGTLLEIGKVDCEGKRSWFIGNYVKSDGSLGVMYPVDPLLVALPLLEKAKNKTGESAGRFLQAEDLFSNDDVSNSQTFLALFQDRLERLCDVKDYQGLFLYRFCEEKTIQYLASKFNTLLEKYEKAELNKLFPEPLHGAGVSDDHRKKVVFDVMSEYLNSTWISKLSKHLNLDEIIQRSKTAFEIDYTKMGREPNENLISKQDSAVAKEKKTSANSNQLKKAATKPGVQSVAKFFKPKEKKRENGAGAAEVCQTPK